VQPTTPPPASEIFNRHQLAARHPTLLSENCLVWALRNRHSNGLEDAGAIFEARSGELLIHEPPFLAWFLGLVGRSKPRRSRKAAAREHREVAA
jgi:hypothetical protein